MSHSSDETIVLGSGMAAWGAFDKLTELGVSPKLFDKNTYPGGHTASFETNGFVFDDGPHISFTEIEQMQQVFAEAVDFEYETLRADVDNWYEGHWVVHPAITNLHGLPTELVVDCVDDFIGANAQPAPDAFANYYEWLLAAYGKTFADNFPTKYGTKYHTVGPELMETSWLGPRLYRAELREVLAGAVAPPTAKQHYIDKFRYPKQDGFVHYLHKFLGKADLELGHEAVAVDPVAKTVTFANGVVQPYGRLLTSAPLAEMVKMLPAPPDVVAAADKLSCSQCVVVNFGVARDDLSPCHWRYIYDLDMPSVRLSFPHMFSPTTVPDGCGAVQVEVYYSDKYKPLDHHPDEDIPRVKADLLRMGILREDDEILVEEARYINYANVIFDLDAEPCSSLVQDYLHDVGIEYCGRYGDWAYIWTDQSYLSGVRAVERMYDS